MGTKLETLVTKEYLLDCMSRGLTQEGVAKEVKKIWNVSISRSSVFYHQRKHGLQWGRRKYIPEELDVEAIVESTDIVEHTLKSLDLVKSYNLEHLDLSDEILHVLVSDVHVGAKYDRTGEIDWVTVVEERFTFLKQGIAERLKKYKMRPKKIILNLLGDLVDGFDIYPNQHERSHPLINDQLDIIINVLMDLILFLYTFTDEVEVQAVQGNHGRISKRTETANWDSVVYLTLDKSIKFMQTVDKDLNIQVHFVKNFIYLYTESTYGWKYLLGHGHKILPRSALSNVDKTIQAMLNKELLGYHHDVFMLGHVHQTRVWACAPNKFFIANGTCYDSEHFSATIGRICDLRFVCFTSNAKSPVDAVWLIKLVPDDYYQKNLSVCL